MCLYRWELVKDDDLRHKVLKDCVKMGIAAKDEKKCQVATEAQVKASGNTIRGLFDKQ